VSEQERSAVDGPVQGHGAGHQIDSVSEPGVRIHPAAGLSLPRGDPPQRRVIRWLSPHERQGHRPPWDIYVERAAYLRLCEHTESDLEHEVGGGLAGRIYFDEAGQRPFLLVEKAIPGRFTRQGNAFITFTQETLVALHEEIDALEPEVRMVGWYHTHPRMGIFLSGYDRWLHHHFFPEPWQVALVVEPFSGSGGFFFRDLEGAVPSREYAGFFEILAPDGTSAMRWGNLEIAGDEGEIDEEGKVSDE
jgi:proteasome lid subunit RPN8/RPN11